MMRILCWWFGCTQERRPADVLYDVEAARCGRCGGCVAYSDLVGDTRHARFVDGAKYWLFRKWYPKKCIVCGNRYRECDWDNEDHIPF